MSAVAEWKLKDAFTLADSSIANKNILLFDDIFCSGETLTAITRIIVEKGKAAKVYVLTLTKTRTKKMNSVFVGGSRSISRLNKRLTHILDNIIEKKLNVLIGDANGADKAIQKYLFSQDYKNVVVYCMENKCRNNLGSWDTVKVITDIKDKTYRYYFVKDSRMASDSQYGLMLWDSKSKGTLNNIINLLKNNKPTVVYFSPTREVQTLKSLQDLNSLIKKCNPRTIEKLDIVLNFQNYRQSSLFPSISETQGTFRIEA